MARHSVRRRSVVVVFSISRSLASAIAAMYGDTRKIAGGNLDDAVGDIERCLYQDHCALFKY
jgi:hypothetical protein